jgi:hypothetical protein
MITQDIQPETSALLSSLTIQRNHVLGGCAGGLPAGDRAR